jgi:predicted nucleic acid-binding protein
MEASPKKSLALDTNFLLDLAEEQDFAHEFKEEFASRGYSLLIPPTVVAELAFFAAQSAFPQHGIANAALEKSASGRSSPSPCLQPNWRSLSGLPRG